MILLIRADSPDVVIRVMNGVDLLAEKKWQAGRELSLQINSVIDDMLQEVEISPKDLTGIIVYEGPGSYTGLRISISVANALGYSLDLPVVGASGDNWIEDGIRKISSTFKFTPIAPVYGGQVYTTKPKK